MTATEPSRIEPDADAGEGKTTVERSSVPVGFWVVVGCYVLFYPLAIVVAWLAPALVNPIGGTLVFAGASPALVNPIGTTLLDVNTAVTWGVTVSTLELFGIYLGLGLQDIRTRVIRIALGVLYLDTMVFLAVWLAWNRPVPLVSLGRTWGGEADAQSRRRGSVGILLGAYRSIWPKRRVYFLSLRKFVSGVRSCRPPSLRSLDGLPIPSSCQVSALLTTTSPTRTPPTPGTPPYPARRRPWERAAMVQ